MEAAFRYGTVAFEVYEEGQQPKENASKGKNPKPVFTFFPGRYLPASGLFRRSMLFGQLTEGTVFLTEMQR